MVDGVLFMLEQMASLTVGVELFVVGLISGVLFTSVGVVDGWCGAVCGRDDVGRAVHVCRHC